MPNPVSFETIDELERLRHYLREIRRISQLPSHTKFPLLNEKLALLHQANDEALACVEKSLQIARTALDQATTDLSEFESKRIDEFDGVLRKLTDLLQLECTKTQDTLDTCLADPTDPMHDFEIDLRIDYQLDECHPSYSVDSDNELTSRDYPMRCRIPGEPSLLSWECGQHCWLFHDLTEINYGLTQPRVPVGKIDVIGSIWAEVVVRRQYLLDTRTGSWLRL